MGKTPDSLPKLGTHGQPSVILAGSREARPTLHLEFACWCSYTKDSFLGQVWLEVGGRRLPPGSVVGGSILQMPCSIEQALAWMAAASGIPLAQVP